MKMETVTKEQVNALKKCIPTISANMMIDWHNIDYDFGRGVIKTSYEENCHCLWTKEGKKIRISVFADGGINIIQSNEIDPFYKKNK